MKVGVFVSSEKEFSIPPEGVVDLGKIVAKGSNLNTNHCDIKFGWDP